MNSDTGSTKATIDLRVFCAALGFATVAAQGEAGLKEGAFRARGMARLIEQFCRTSIPEAFTEDRANT